MSDFKLVSSDTPVPNSPYQPLFNLMSSEHGLTLLESEMSEIMSCVREIDKSTVAQYGPAVKTPEEILKKNSGLFDADFTSHEFTMTAAECVISMKEFANQVPLILMPKSDTNNNEPTTEAEAEALIWKLAEKFNLHIEIY